MASRWTATLPKNSCSDRIYVSTHGVDVCFRDRSVRPPIALYVVVVQHRLETGELVRKGIVPAVEAALVVEVLLQFDDLFADRKQVLVRFVEQAFEAFGCRQLPMTSVMGLSVTSPSLGRHSVPTSGLADWQPVHPDTCGRDGHGNKH